MKQFVFLMVMMSFALSVNAENLRVYCKPDGVVFEVEPIGGGFTEENKISELKQYETIIVEEGDVPSPRFRPQLRCQGGKLIVDETIITPAMIKQEQIKQAQAALDAELGKAEPDIITVMRLQRAIEQIKKGN